MLPVSLCSHPCQPSPVLFLLQGIVYGPPACVREMSKHPSKHIRLRPFLPSFTALVHRRTTDSTASRRSIETMSPPSVPLKRSPGSFSDSDPHPTTDRRRAGPAQASTLPIDSKAKASTSSFPSPGPHFQFQAHNPTPRSLQVPPPHPGTSGAPPTDTFYNTRPPTLQTDSQITRTITVTSTSPEPSLSTRPPRLLLFARL